MFNGLLRDSSGNNHHGRIIGAKWVQVNDELKVIEDTEIVAETHLWPKDQPAPAIAPFNADEAKQHQAAWAKHLGVEVETTNSIGMKFRVIPPGEFLMGSSEEEIAKLLEEGKAERRQHFEGHEYQYQIELHEELTRSERPQHRVTLTKPFGLAAHEVTRGQFRQFVNNTGYKTEAEEDRKGGAGLKNNRWVQQSPEFLWNTRVGFETEPTDNHPVFNVSWNDALAFCNWLSEKEGVKYRLPTEAEWEFSCRSGSLKRYHFGADASMLKEYAWHRIKTTSSVGQKIANAFGLFDMYGSEQEWCGDRYGPYSTGPVINPVGPSQGSDRVIRGGAYVSVRRTASCGVL